MESLKLLVVKFEIRACWVRATFARPRRLQTKRTKPSNR
jgi:hypothetical protein